MNKKIILIIIAVIVILIIIAAIILIQKDKSISSPSPSDQKKVSEETPLETEEKEQVDQIAILKSQLSLQARSFIARYGTYSSDNRYGNLKMLLPQMSVKFAQETSRKISLKEEIQGFVSLTTKVMNLTLKEFDKEADIYFVVQVQEREIRSDQTELKQRVVEISFIKENDQWKVDEVSYKNLASLES